VILLSHLVILGCGEPPATPEELERAASGVAAQYRDRIVEQHAKYLEIARIAAAVPAENLPAIDLGEGRTLPGVGSAPERADIDLPFLLDHTIDPWHANDFLCLGDTFWFQSPIYWLDGEYGDLFRDRTPAKVTRFMTERFDGFLGTKYLMVFRAHEFEEPVLLKKDAAPKDYFGRKIVGSFVPGSITGDVLVIDVEEMKCLGGVTFHAKSSSMIDTARSRTDPDYVRNDLLRNARSAARKALKPYVGTD
jgi:hypothetical protein